MPRVLFQAMFVIIFLTSALQVFALPRQQLIHSVDAFYDWANHTYGKHGNPVPEKATLRKQLGKIFAKRIVHRLNGEIVARNLNDMTDRFNRFKQKYDHAIVRRPYQEMVVDPSNNKVAIRYKIDFYSQKAKLKTLYALTIFKVNQSGKLIEFNEISSVHLDHIA